MANKPGFIVDPSGNVRDVRNESSDSTSPPAASQSSGTGASPRVVRMYSRGRETPGRVIFIPIGLIFALLMLVLRMTAQSGTLAQNSYSELGVSSLNQGLYYYDEGDYEKAIFHFNLALKEEPGMSEAYNDRGLAYAAMYEDHKALADFDRAIELDPSSAGAYNNRGALHLSQGNHEQALADLNKAIELSPRLAKAYHNRGLTYLDLGEADQAIADFDKAIEMTPEAMFAAQATMESRTAGVEGPNGMNFIRGLMNRDDYADLPRAYAGRAMAYLQKGDDEKAKADLEKATSLGLDPLFAYELLLKSPVIPSLPQAGTWQGTASHAGYVGMVSFDMGVDGQIHDFQLELIFGRHSLCQVTAQDVWLEPDNTFSFAFGAPATEGANLVQGRFETGTSVSGNLSSYIECRTTTGQFYNGDLTSGAYWTAAWIDGPDEAYPALEYAQPATTDPIGEAPRMDVRSLAVDPVTPTTLYAGTPAGVFKSTDAGQHWSQAIEGMSYNYVNALAIDPSAPQTLYAGSSLGVFKSTDGAASWTSVADELFAHTGVLSLVIDPQAPETLYAGTITGVLKSMDGGLHWSEANRGLGAVLVYALAVDPSATRTIYAGTPDGVFKSTDGGQYWHAARDGLTDGFVQVLVVDPHAPATLYAGTQNGFFKSVDGGASWNNSFLTDAVVTVALDPRTPDSLYIGRSDMLYASADGGAHWSPIYGPGSPLYINMVTVDPLTPGALYAGTDEGLFRVTAGGEKWILLFSGTTE